MAQPYVTNTFRDRSKELSTCSYYVASDEDGTNQTAINNAIDSFIIGIRAKTELVFPTLISNGTPTNVLANRETKALVTYEDTVTLKKYVMTLPMPNVTNDAIIAGTDFFDLGDTEAGAFVTAFEAGAKSEVGNPVNVLSIKLVGRNL